MKVKYLCTNHCDHNGSDSAILYRRDRTLSLAGLRLRQAACRRDRSSARAR